MKKTPYVPLACCVAYTVLYVFYCCDKKKDNISAFPQPGNLSFTRRMTPSQSVSVNISIMYVASAV